MIVKKVAEIDDNVIKKAKPGPLGSEKEYQFLTLRVIFKPRFDFYAQILCFFIL